ncbi:MAG: GNAT family N-acetyltransferase, partial [Planctomycetales bacterium]
INDSPNVGAIQNLGVTPEHRGRGLGRALLLGALHGFFAAGLRHAFLEVTSHNGEAIELYHDVGFRRVRTLYKVVNMTYF